MSHDKYYQKYNQKTDWPCENAPHPCPFGTTLKSPPVAFHVILQPFKNEYSHRPTWCFVGMYFSSSHDPADLSDIEHSNMTGYETDRLCKMKNITLKISYRFERLEGTSIATRYWPIERGFKHHGGCIESVALTFPKSVGNLIREAAQ